MCDQVGHQSRVYSGTARFCQASLPETGSGLNSTPSSAMKARNASFALVSIDFLAKARSALMRLWYSAARSTGCGVSWAAAATARPLRIAAPRTKTLVISTPLNRPGMGPGLLSEPLLISLDGHRRPVGMERHHLLVAPDIDRPAVAPVLGNGGLHGFPQSLRGLEEELWHVRVCDRIGLPLRVVQHQRRVGNRRIDLGKIPKPARIAPPDHLLRNRVATRPHPFLNTFQSQLWTWNPQEEDVEPVSHPPELLEERHPTLSRQRRFEPEIRSRRGESLDPLEHELARLDGEALRVERGKPSRDQVGVDELAAVRVVGQEQAGERALSRSVRPRHHIEVRLPARHARSIPWSRLAALHHQSRISQERVEPHHPAVSSGGGVGFEAPLEAVAEPAGT